jgi:hypothetical protein
MGGIRPYAPADAPQVLALHERTLPIRGPQGAEALNYHTRLYRKVLFDHPWLDDDLPSLVYEQDDGTLIGFLGVMPRPMTFGGRRIRAAVSVRFMADPSSRYGSLAATALHRRYLRGPQELSVVENANIAAQRVWARTPGVVVVSLGSISWTATKAPEPAWDGADAPLDGAELLDCIRSAAEPCALQPVYETDSLRWLIEFLNDARYRGAFHSRAVRDDAGGVRGWYAYYSNPNGYNGVFALHAPTGDADRTLRSLLDHARRSGGAARTVGRLHPAVICAVADQNCALSPGPWTFAYSLDPHIAHALAAGDGFFTRLDGEFC